MPKKLNNFQQKILRDFDSTRGKKKNYTKPNPSAIKTGAARKRVEDIMEAKAFAEAFDLL